MPEFKILNEPDIRKAIDMRTAIELMKDAFVQISQKTAQVLVRSSLEGKDGRGKVLFMPAYSPHYNLFGLKMVSVFPENTKKHLPSIQGKVLLMDDIMGTPLGLIDAGYLTALRTGAASGLATQLLSNPDSKTLALFGTGAQAFTQVEAILCVRKINKIIVFATTEENAKKFCSWITKNFDIPAVRGTREMIKEADVICTATTSTHPLFELTELKAGVHINGIGSYKPEVREISSNVIRRSLLVVDHRESTLSEAGDVIIPIQEKVISEDHIHAELGEIVAGKKSGRTDASQITVFKSVGNAVQDLAMANYLMK